jgi:hypothetical protein
MIMHFLVFWDCWMQSALLRGATPWQGGELCTEV